MTKFLCLWALLTVTSHSFAAQSANVLLLNSYHPQYRWTAELTKGVRDALKGEVSPENLHIEYMDARRYVDDKQYEAKLIALLKYKYQFYKPDVIITSDDHAYYFMIAQGKELFGDTPIVFCGVNVFYPETMAGRSNITGIQEGMEIQGNLDLIVRLQPDIKQIVLLGDTTGLGLRMVAQAWKIKAQWTNNKVKLEIWDKFSLPELYQKAADMDIKGAFLMLAIHKDSEGNYFSFDQELPILTARSKVPVYGMWGALMIGNGVIGGMMNSPYQHGHKAAEMAQKILQGVPISEIPVESKANYSPFFDYHQLTRFGIDIKRLPKNSVIIDAPVSLYEQHRELINGVVLLILFLMVVITVLLISIRQRKLAQEQLMYFNQQLESIVHERTRDLEDRNLALEQASRKLVDMANTDILTGLGNRRAANNEVIGFIKRYNVVFQPLGLAILDIDFFKKINDNHGHQVGDEVLVAIAQTLQNALRPSDRIYRWGGEEFLIVLPDTEASIAAQVCQRVRIDVSKITIENIPKITASLGLANFISGDSYNELLQRADEALYIAKNQGRDQVVIAPNNQSV